LTRGVDSGCWLGVLTRGIDSGYWIGVLTGGIDQHLWLLFSIYWVGLDGLQLGHAFPFSAKVWVTLNNFMGICMYKWIMQDHEHFIVLPDCCGSSAKPSSCTCCSPTQIQLLSGVDECVYDTSFLMWSLLSVWDLAGKCWKCQHICFLPQWCFTIEWPECLEQISIIIEQHIQHWDSTETARWLRSLSFTMKQQMPTHSMLATVAGHHCR